jgi:hypothetical protein
MDCDAIGGMGMETLPNTRQTLDLPQQPSTPWLTVPQSFAD